MEFLVVGLNHRTAPLEIRERLSLTKAQLPDALKAMEGYGVPGVILSTCNRAEFYALEPQKNEASPRDVAAGDTRIRRFLVDHFDVSLLDVERYLYIHRDLDCVQHLFRVTASLDSMILGEEQIIGQVREAFEVASQAGTVKGPLSQLFQQALRVARRARRETGIGQNALSVSRACVELAKSALGDLTQLQAMVVGAGDAGGLAAEVLSHAGVKQIMVTNRTYERATELADHLSGRAIPFQEMPDALRSVDIVIGCTGSPGYVLDAGTVKEAMLDRPQRPLFMIDIAVPRDFDPQVGDIHNVFLHDMDDLESASQASRMERQREAESAEGIIEEESKSFFEWCRDLEVLPTVAALREKAERIREAELSKTLRRFNGKLNDEDLASLDAMTRAIVNKLLHDPTVYLKGGKGSRNLDVAKQIFDLTDKEQ